MSPQVSWSSSGSGSTRSIVRARDAALEIKAPPHVDCLLGYPGIAESNPRLQGLVELRATTDLPVLQICKVTIELDKYESVRSPDAMMMTNSRIESHVSLGNPIVLFTATDGKEYEEVLAMDLPFHIPLDRFDLSPSVDGSMFKTSYNLVAKYFGPRGSIIKLTRPVLVDRFDVLSTLRRYNIPTNGHSQSIDHCTSISAYLPITSVGPGDILPIELLIQRNIEIEKSSKAKLIRVRLEVNEICSFQKKGSNQAFSRRIYKEDVEIGPAEVAQFASDEGLTLNLSCQVIPSNNSGESSQDFSISAKLYKVYHEIVIHASMNKTKDLNIKIPFRICKWSREECRDISASICENVWQQRREQDEVIIKREPPFRKGTPFRASSWAGFEMNGVNTKKILIS